MRFYLVVFSVLISFLSCKEKSANSVDVSKVDISFPVKRFDVDFYTAKTQELSSLKKEYPYFFPAQVTDSLSLAKMMDTEEQELFAETQKIYKDFTPIETQLTSLFKHIKYYNPPFKTPKVITMLTNIAYDNRVVYADSLLIISLDVYLGKEHPFYADYPKYIKENNTKNHLIVDVANQIIAHQVPLNSDRRFVAKMISEGKKMYLLDRYLPEVSEKEKMGFEVEKLTWIHANEEQIWTYFMDKQLLFSTDTNLNKRFLEPAPFSKFYMEHDNLSPGRVGVWMGWQIVQSYMQHNSVSLQELLNVNATDLLKKSNYKPRK